MFLLTTALAFAPTLPADLDTSPLAAFVATPDSHTENKRAMLSYSFIELGAAKYDVDTADDEADVFYGKASLGFFDHFYAFGEYSNSSLDTAFGDVDTDLITVGGGAHFGVMEKLDLYAEIGWLFTDTDFDDDSGHLLAGGARWMALPWDGGGLELDAEIGQYGLDLGSEEDPVYWELGARAHFLNAFSVGAAYQMLEDDDQVSVNARFSF